MLVFIMGVYKRHELTEIVLDYYRELQKKYPFKIVIAGSEGESSRALCHGFDYIEVENFPISNKNNAMMLKAKEFNPDAVVLLGSDNMICENTLKFYYKLVKQKEANVVGFYDVYFYSTEHEMLVHFDSGMKSYGAGRYYPRTVLDKLNFKGWTGSYDRGLDGNNMRNMIAHGITSRVVKLIDSDLFLVDVKHNFSISNKNIIFMGKQVNNKIMARKKIPVEKLDALPIKKNIMKLDESDKSIFESAKNVDEPLKLEANKIYTFVSNGKSRFLVAGLYQLSGYECEIFIKKGYGELK
jgi:hypothetical protein